jgi:hypothetical protein
MATTDRSTDAGAAALAILSAVYCAGCGEMPPPTTSHAASDHARTSEPAVQQTSHRHATSDDRPTSEPAPAGTIQRARHEGVVTGSDGASTHERGLCPVDWVYALVHVEKGIDRVTITVTTTDETEVDEVQLHASRVAASGDYVPAAAYEEMGVPVQVVRVNLANGVQIVLIPQRPADLANLARYVDADEKMLAERDCLPGRSSV